MALGGNRIYRRIVPRYFFHLYNDEVSLDEEGRELADLAAACENALKEAREMLSEAIAGGRINLSHRIDIADVDGAVLGVVTFGDAVRVEG